MKIIDLDQFRHDRQLDQAPYVVRDLVEDFRRRLQDTVCLQDGEIVDLRAAMKLLTWYWGNSDGQRPEPDGIKALRQEVESLQDERDYWDHELRRTRDELAILECPFQELDILEHRSGAKGWVFRVHGGRDGGYIAQVRECDKSGRPLNNEGFWKLVTAEDAAAWRQVGKLPEAEAKKLAWMPRRG